MKKNMNEMVRRSFPQYLGGVPGTEKRKYWSGSPWSAFLALTGSSVQR